MSLLEVTVTMAAPSGWQSLPACLMSVCTSVVTKHQTSTWHMVHPHGGSVGKSEQRLNKKIKPSPRSLILLILILVHFTLRLRINEFLFLYFLFYRKSILSYSHAKKVSASLRLVGVLSRTLTV